MENKMKKIKESTFDKIIKSKLLKLTEDFAAEVDKETWGEPEETETVETEIDNEELIHVDEPEEVEEDEESAAEFIMKAQGIEPKSYEPNTPRVLSEFDDLTNEEKKALLLKLAKNDNDLNALLTAYMQKKLDEESSEEEKEYATHATEMGSGDASDD